MGKKKGKSGSGEGRYSITQANLDRKGKTNKKLKLNPQASRYLTAFGKQLKEESEAKAKAVFKTGKRTKAKERRAAEEAAKRAAETNKNDNKKNTSKKSK